MKAIFEKLPQQARGRLKRAEQPVWVEPMLATLTQRRFSDKNWIYERKLDGERCLAFRQAGELRLLFRNQKNINHQYPELVGALQKQATQHFILDGEVVAFKGNVTSFSRLQDRMHIENPDEVLKTGVAVYYYIFDLLYLEGYDVSAVSLRERKVLLKAALKFDDPLRYVIHRNQEGEAYFEDACQKGWEGIVAKDARSPYEHSRSNKWFKFKCLNQQEFVIGGYTAPQGSRIGFGALLLGYYQDNDLQYAGKVGTGFNDNTLKRLSDRLADLVQDASPFSEDDLPTEGVHWVKPKLVAEIGFEEWTEYGKLCQPRYLGLRQDKDARNVVMEIAEP
jgi:bifunctional non-homologous end joining protein LigD